MSRIFEKNSLQRNEILKSKRAISALFLSGEKIYNHPILIYYKAKQHERPSPIKVAFSVSTKKWKKAADRNRIKRWLREAYRINKHSLLNTAETHTIGIDLMVIYVSDKTLPFEPLCRKMVIALQQLQRTVVTT